MRIQVFADRYISSGNLIQVIIFAKFLQCQLGQTQREQRIYRKIKLIQRMCTPCLEKLKIRRGCHQIGKSLHSIPLKIRMLALHGCPPSEIKFVKLAKFPFFRSIRCDQRSRSFEIMIIKKLIGIAQRFVFLNIIDRGYRFLPLLEIVIVNGGNEKKFGKCVIQPKRFVTVGKEVALFTNTLHPSEGTVPVIIKFFVERCPLADFHQSDVCNQQLKLIFSQLVYLFMIRLGTVEIHIHESTEPQIIGSFRFPRLIQVYLPICFIGVFVGRVQITVTISIRFSIQRVDKPHFFCGHHVGTRKKGGKQQYSYYI